MRLRRRRLVYLVGFVVLGGGLGFGAACLPDLDSVPSATPHDGSEETIETPDNAVPPNKNCGNGIIEDDAGEQCDPGEGGAVGCTSTCQIDCTSPVDGGEAFIDKSSNHCYFTLGQDTYNSAINRCTSAGAHLVTFVSDMEYTTVITADAATSQQQVFWVGLKFLMTTDAGDEYTSVTTNPQEPGWAPYPACPGCYAYLAQNPMTTTHFPRDVADGGGGNCVVASSLSGWDTWRSTGCFVEKKLVVCEREPPGTRAIECLPDWCITVKSTVGHKRYLFHPNINPSPTNPVEMTPKQAEGYCQLWGDAGASSSLVVLDTREEREQLWRELYNAGIAMPQQFWIGARDAPDGGGWNWDDGQTVQTTFGGTPPPPWGIGAPEPLGATRAYAQLAPGNPDTQLAHAAPGETQYLPFVCQAVP